jgi:hypothetical protein
MKYKPCIRQFMTTLCVASAALAACADKETPTGAATEGAAESQGSPKVDTSALIAQDGVDQGPLERTEGTAAVMAQIE